MNIFVCLKQVPARDSLLRVNSSASWIDDEDLTLEMNEPDSYALEEGLASKKSTAARSSPSPPAAHAPLQRSAKPWPKVPTAAS